MKMYETLSFAKRPKRIGNLIPAMCLDSARINHDFGDDAYTEFPGEPAQNWNERRIAEVLAAPNAADLVIVNMEGVNFANPHYTFPDTMNMRKVLELEAWLNMIRRWKQPTARIALDGIAWGMDSWGNAKRDESEEAGRRVRYINDLIRERAIPLVDYTCLQAYWITRWGDFATDLNGADGLYGNRQMWQTFGPVMAAYSGKPTIAFFSPSNVSLNPKFPVRPLTEDEMNQAMYYLSSAGFAGLAWWGSVPGKKTPSQGWDIYDASAGWLKTLGQYVSTSGDFIPNPQWPAGKMLA